MTDFIQPNFALEPIESIEPWGSEGERKLHWFGLTSGVYWIGTSKGDVLRYTEEATEQFGATFPYVDYQVARLFEDVQQQRPYALEPIPEDMAAIASDAEWYERSKTWRDARSDEECELWFDAWSGGMREKWILATCDMGHTSACGDKEKKFTSAGGIQDASRYGPCRMARSDYRWRSFH